jgi:hypothetical protein
MPKTKQPTRFTEGDAIIFLQPLPVTWNDENGNAHQAIIPAKTEAHIQAIQQTSNSLYKTHYGIQYQLPQQKGHHLVWIPDHPKLHQHITFSPYSINLLRSDGSYLRYRYGLLSLSYSMPPFPEILIAPLHLKFSGMQDSDLKKQLDALAGTFTPASMTEFHSLEGHMFTLRHQPTNSFLLSITLHPSYNGPSWYSQTLIPASIHYDKTIMIGINCILSMENDQLIAETVGPDYIPMRPAEIEYV